LKKKKADNDNQGGKKPAGKNDKLYSGSVTVWVTRAQKGDVDAFRRLYEHFAGKILNYLFRMTGSRDRAEDLAQDTFVLAHRKIADLKNPARFQSWLFRIAQNNAYQFYRGKKIRIDSIGEEESQELSDIQKLATPIKSPEEAVLTDELERKISRAIEELPEKYRTVFVLSAIQKLSYQEISEIVDRSLASVKSDIHRARVIIRDRIREYLKGNDGLPRL